MNPQRPTVAYSICMQNACDGPSYCAYYDAYSLEMSMDDEWPINIMVAVPPHLTPCITQQAEITSMGASAAASYPPTNGDFTQLREAGASWVFAHPFDRIDAILDNGLNVLVCVEDSDQLNDVLACDRISENNAIIAFQITSATSIDDAATLAAKISTKLTGRGLSKTQLLVSGSYAHKNILDYTQIPHVNGLLMLDSDFAHIIELLNEYVLSLIHI